MAMDAFAIMVGFIGIVVTLISIILALCVWKVSVNPENMKKQAGWLMLTSLVYLVFSILGFVNYSDSSNDCKQSPLGEVVLAWSIIKIISSCCGCVQGGVATRAE